MKRHLTPSLLISLIALFVALGGTGYAVSKLPKNSVGSAQIKKNAVTSEKVKNGSLLSKDFKAGQLPKGATGPQGAKGDTGATGPTGLSGYQQVNVYSAADATDTKSAIAYCPAGTKVIGGGAVIGGGPTKDIALNTSLPISGGEGWVASAYETAPLSTSWNIAARAICATVAP